MTSNRFTLRNIAAAAAVALTCGSAALALTPSASAEAQARYRQDLAVCNSGKSNQDLATCRLEARNALAEARRGGLNDDAGLYQKNMLQRCSAHAGTDRSDCEARMGSQGSIEGSAASGGILRRGVTIVPGQ